MLLENSVDQDKLAWESHLIGIHTVFPLCLCVCVVVFIFSPQLKVSFNKLMKYDTCFQGEWFRPDLQI